MSESPIDPPSVDDARNEADKAFDERSDEIQREVDSITEKVNEALTRDPEDDDEPLA